MNLLTWPAMTTSTMKTISSVDDVAEVAAELSQDTKSLHGPNIDVSLTIFRGQTLTRDGMAISSRFLMVIILPCQSFLHTCKKKTNTNPSCAYMCLTPNK